MKRSGKGIAAALLILSITAAGFPAMAKPNVIYQEKEASGPWESASYIPVKTDNLDMEPQFNGGTVKFLSNDASMTQQLCGIFQSSDGKLLVVDGGVPENADKLISAVNEFGGTVDAWLITHPQTDHVGALYEILHNKKGSIKIKNIYYNFHDFMWYASADPDEQGAVWNIMTEFNEMRSAATETVLHDNIKKGDVINISDKMSFRVLNDPLKIDNSPYSVNDSGIMYDLTFEGKHFFLLGDMGPDGGDILLNEGVLEGAVCDYCVMAHHGQNGVNESFYKKLAPKACIWSCPSWLYDAGYGNSRGFKTYETKQWIKSMNINENYCTYDKDIVLR